MNELLRLRIAAVVKANRVGKLLDLRLRSGQEVPAAAIGLGIEMLIDAGDINLLARSRIVRRLVRIEAYGDDFVILARRKLQHAQRAGLAYQLFAAKHRAGVINQVQNHRAAGLKVVAQLYRSCRFHP